MRLPPATYFAYMVIFSLPPLPSPLALTRYRSRISFRSRLRWSRSNKYFKTAARPSTIEYPCPVHPVARLNFRTIVETRVSSRTTREFNFLASERTRAGGGGEESGGSGGLARINSRPPDEPFSAELFRCIADTQHRRPQRVSATTMLHACIVEGVPVPRNLRDIRTMGIKRQTIPVTSFIVVKTHPFNVSSRK